MGLKREPKFGFLLAGILGFLIFGPVAEEFLGSADSFVVMGGYSTMLVIGLISLQEVRLWFIVGIVLASLSVVLVALDWLIDSPIIDLLAMLNYLLFQLLAMWMATQHLVSKYEVSVNKIIGGTCVYLLLGMTWSILYVIAYWLNPDSFTGVNLTDFEGQLYWDMTYFSFVTLTTLGYGDILPISALPKALAYVEAVIGQIFVAVLIGALVATYTSQRGRKPIE
jgi:hypothetical protein